MEVAPHEEKAVPSHAQLLHHPVLRHVVGSAPVVTQGGKTHKTHVINHGNHVIHGRQSKHR
eukprot:2827639-Ditylum_brightwellii.AAC.1